MGSTLEYLQSLYDEYQKPELEFNADCHDCRQRVKIICTLADNGKLEIEGGAIYKVEGIEKPFFKCDDCFKKEHQLRNYQPCEVYSRVVGYLSPRQRWNEGKQEEWKMRKNFKI